MTVEELNAKCNALYPYELALEWDNSGLQIGSINQNVTKVLVTLDITREVVLEAIEEGVELIIAHHPLLFRPIQQIKQEDYIGRLLYSLIEHQISVISLHTNFDNADGGMNSELLKVLGAKNERKTDYDDTLRIGEITRTSIGDLIKKWQDVLPIKEMRYSGKDNALIETIGVIGGSGSSPKLIEQLIASKEVDLFVTGDTKSYEARYAKENGLNVLDISHNNEWVFVDKVIKDLHSTELTFIKSKINTEAYTYHF